MSTLVHHGPACVHGVTRSPALHGVGYELEHVVFQLRLF
jgi:hypothetical protein